MMKFTPDPQETVWQWPDGRQTPWEDFRRAVEMMTWQPIETAPRDGEEILLYATVHAMLYPKSKPIPGHWSRGWWNDDRTLSHVTHWMPLPDPPKVTDAKNKA